MFKVVGLDIGSGFTKCFDGERRLLFPSVYAYHQPSLWEDSESIVEGTGEAALEIAQYPSAVRLYPVVDGRPQHHPFLKLAEEALRRLVLCCITDFLTLSPLAVCLRLFLLSRVTVSLMGFLHRSPSGACC